MKNIKNNILGSIGSRRCGRTTEWCRSIAALVKVGETKKIVCALRKYSDIGWLLPIMHKAFEKIGLPFERTAKYVWMSGNIEIRFVSEADERELLGLARSVRPVDSFLELRVD